MFKRKADGLRPNDRAAPLAATRNVHLFSPFPRGKLGIRADVHACPRSRARASESRNAFLYSPSHEIRNWSARESLAIEFFIAPIIFLLSRVASNIHAIFIVTTASGFFLCVLFIEVEKREEKMEGRRRTRSSGKREERKSLYGVAVKIA